MGIYKDILQRLRGEESSQSHPIKSKDITDYIEERINEFKKKRKTQPTSELFIRESELFKNLAAESEIEKQSIRWGASSFIDTYNSINRDLIIKTDINHKNMHKAKLFREQIIEPSLLGKDVISDQREITIATKKLFSDILDEIYDLKLGLDLNARDTIFILMESYCLCLFAKIGFTHDSQILQNVHKYSKKEFLDYINSILSTNRENQYQDLEMNKIVGKMIDNIPGYYELLLKNLQILAAEVSQKYLTTLKKYDELMMASTILSQHVEDYLKMNYGVDSKMCSQLGKAVQNTGIQAAFQIAGLEINSIK